MTDEGPQSRAGATRKDVENYLLAMRKDGKRPSTRNVTLASIRALLRAKSSVEVRGRTSVPSTRTDYRLG